MDGLWAGTVDHDPSAGRRGRVRRWSYAAAGGDAVRLGVAVVDIGFAATAFVWCHLADGTMATWDARGLPRLHARVARTATGTSTFRAGGATLAITGGGDVEVDVPTSLGRLVAGITTQPGTPAVLATPTPSGGWNVTCKAAGEPARLEGRLGSTPLADDGGTWRDWTCGAQDRHTTWRWVAAAGAAADGRRVGLNASTGMNGAGAREDVVWWDGVPHRLEVTSLAPVVAAEPAGDWRVAGPGWALEVATSGVRAADEDLWLVRSRYVQPVGHLTGTVPGPDGRPVAVDLVGVAEDHEARW